MRFSYALGKFLSALIGYCDYGSKTLTRKRSADNTFEFSSQAFPQIIYLLRILPNPRKTTKNEAQSEFQSFYLFPVRTQSV